MHTSKTLVQGLKKASEHSLKPRTKDRLYNESFLSAEQARDLFIVDGGLLINRVSRGARALEGEVAGSMNSNGYLRVRINNVPYRVHRIIWLITYGKWPEGQIDHINGVTDDNRIENLRDVSTQDNQRNQRVRTDNSSGVPGVRVENGKWRVRIKVDGKYVCVGRFKDFDSAVSARKNAEALYGFHPNHGATDYQRRTSLVRGAA